MKQLRQLARSWNNLDTSFIETELADNFVYESQWVLMPIEGRQQFLTYLKAKFEAIKTATQFEGMSVTAEMASHPYIRGRPCIVLTQKCAEEVRQVTILITSDKKKIKRIETCFIPNPSKAKLSGEFPK